MKISNSSCLKPTAALCVGCSVLIATSVTSLAQPTNQSDGTNPSPSVTTNQSDATNPNQQFFTPSTVLPNTIETYLSSPNAAVGEGSTTTGASMTPPELILLIQNARKRLELQRDSARVIFASPEINAGNISPQQLQALVLALNKARDAAQQAEDQFRALTKDNSTTVGVLNANLKANRILRSALIGLLQQLSGLPRNGSPDQQRAIIAAVDNVAELTLFLENVAPALQQMRDQALSS